MRWLREHRLREHSCVRGCVRDKLLEQPLDGTPFWRCTRMLVVAHQSDPSMLFKSRVARRLVGCSSMAKVDAVRVEETWPKEGALSASVGVPLPMLSSGR